MNIARNWQSHVMWLTPAENPGGGGIVNLSVSYLWKISEKFSWAPVNPEKLKSILLQNILPRVSMDRGMLKYNIILIGILKELVTSLTIYEKINKFLTLNSSVELYHKIHLFLLKLFYLKILNRPVLNVVSELRFDENILKF